MRDRFVRVALLIGVIFLGALLGSQIFGCGGGQHIDPCDVEASMCMVNGGDWVADPDAKCGGRCVYPPPPPPPPPPPTDCRTEGCDEGFSCKKVGSGPNPKYYCVPDPCTLCVEDETCIDGRCVPDAPPPPKPPCKDVEHLMVWAGDMSPEFRTRVKVATSTLGDLSGSGTQEEMHRLSSKNLKILAAMLREQNPGMCAFGGIEALFILRSDGLWGEYHAVYFGKGSWTDNGFGKYKGSHRVKDAPPPPPPPGLACGGDFAKWNHKCPLPVGKWYTCTPLVGPDGDYCASQGWTDGRLFCPPRPNGDPERQACEVKVMGGDPDWTSDGHVIHKNRLMARARGGAWLKICLKDGSNCRKVRF